MILAKHRDIILCGDGHQLSTGDANPALTVHHDGLTILDHIAVNPSKLGEGLSALGAYADHVLITEPR
jgi:hypothetical protein